MKILFVHPSTEMSIGDVGRGYRAALERQGHEISDYYFSKRLHYHFNAVPKGVSQEIISRMASETILNEAMYQGSDLVVIVSGLNLHPIALWLLGKLNIPAAVIFTESPYDDEAQGNWASLKHVNSNVDLTVFTNDRYSAEKYGWNLLPPSYDPAIHYPADPDPDVNADVLMVGTGWGERQQYLEAVDWTGINLKLYGIWPGLAEKPESPLYDSYIPLVVNNAHISGMYRAAKICLNFHRASPVALTPGPRAYEIAASEAFQLSDPRLGMAELFGDSVPIFTSPQDLGKKIRYYLQHPEERLALAAQSRKCVKNQTFDRRAEELVSVLRHHSLSGQGV